MKQMSKGLRTVLIGVAALLVLSCGLCMIVLIIAPNSEETETRSAVVTEATAAHDRAATVDDDAPAATEASAEDAPTAEATTRPTELPPTATRQSTATPRVTTTPRPTSTPRPTATANAAATDAAREAATSVAVAAGERQAELAYAEAILQISNDYMDALDGIAAQSELASENPYLILNDDWKVSTAFYLAALQIAGEAVRELEPPARFTAAHANLLTAADHYDLVARYYAEGVDDMDSAKLALATTHMQLGSEAIQQATLKLQGLKN